MNEKVLILTKTVDLDLHCLLHKSLDARKPVFGQGFANNKGPDQPAYPGSLISAFVISLLESIISRIAISNFSIF